MRTPGDQHNARPRKKEGESFQLKKLTHENRRKRGKNPQEGDGQQGPKGMRVLVEGPASQADLNAHEKVKNRRHKHQQGGRGILFSLPGVRKIPGVL